jgi:hypothetical protein
VVKLELGRQVHHHARLGNILETIDMSYKTFMSISHMLCKAEKKLESKDVLIPCGSKGEYDIQPSLVNS